MTEKENRLHTDINKNMRVQELILPYWLFLNKKIIIKIRIRIIIIKVNNNNNGNDNTKTNTKTN